MPHAAQLHTRPLLHHATYFEALPQSLSEIFPFRLGITRIHFPEHSPQSVYQGLCPIALTCFFGSHIGRWADLQSRRSQLLGSWIARCSQDAIRTAGRQSKALALGQAEVHQPLSEGPIVREHQA